VADRQEPNLAEAGDIRGGKEIELGEIAKLWKGTEPDTERDPISQKHQPPPAEAATQSDGRLPGPDPAPTANARAQGNEGSDRDRRFVPQRLELPWFDVDACLAELRKNINRADGNRWESVSMPDGLVYCSPEGLWRALNDSTAGNPILAATAADRESQRNILYSAVWEMAEKKGAIATGMLESDHYLIRVTIITGSGRISPISPLLIPFLAEPAFGVPATALEGEKGLAIRRMVAAVKPRPGVEVA
jgi:hypothetical protein